MKMTLRAFLLSQFSSNETVLVGESKVLCLQQIDNREELHLKVDGSNIVFNYAALDSADQVGDSWYFPDVTGVELEVRFCG
ncbi:hypothetical protein ACE02P_17840 [Shewanella bicestrii]